MSGREAFESVMRANGVDDFTRYHPDRDYISSTVQVAWAVWQARDAEIAAKDARIAKMEAELQRIQRIVECSKGISGGPRKTITEWSELHLPQGIEEALR